MTPSDHRDPADPLGQSNSSETVGTPPANTTPTPMTRRQARELETREAQPNVLQWNLDSNDESEPTPPRKKRKWVRVLIVVVILLALFGAGGTYVWFTFQPQVLKILQLAEPNDYSGRGTGSVTVTIVDGDIGSDIATTLHKDGVVKTSTAFYQLLLTTKPDPVFQPGAYTLKKRMSAESALAALQDPANKVTRTVTIIEGTIESAALKSVSKVTGIPLDDLIASAKDPKKYGLPSQAKTLEGFLFPARYTFDPEASADDVIKTMVDRSFDALDDAGVPADQRWRVVTLASIVQKESGPKESDFGKIARVFVNRLTAGMPLQSDATVQYGIKSSGSVWTSDKEREDENNPFNTYVHKGLPPAPIGNPGDVAIKAALHPTNGTWMYFVSVNLKSGQTVFSTTYAQHEAAVKKLQDWCNASAENDEYCK